jgi:hypothetical protein
MPRDLTPHQRRIIERYYANRDAIDAQRLQELVSEIFLAGQGRRADRLWARATAILERAPDLEPALVRRIVEARDLELLAEVAGR